MANLFWTCWLDLFMTSYDLSLYVHRTRCNTFFVSPREITVYLWTIKAGCMRHRTKIGCLNLQADKKKFQVSQRAVNIWIWEGTHYYLILNEWVRINSTDFSLYLRGLYRLANASLHQVDFYEAIRVITYSHTFIVTCSKQQVLPQNLSFNYTSLY